MTLREKEEVTMTRRNFTNPPPSKQNYERVNIKDNSIDSESITISSDYPPIILSVESQKGVNAIQGCSIENQKGTIAAQSLCQ